MRTLKKYIAVLLAITTLISTCLMSYAEYDSTEEYPEVEFGKKYVFDEEEYIHLTFVATDNFFITEEVCDSKDGITGCEICYSNCYYEPITIYEKEDENYYYLSNAFYLEIGQEYDVYVLGKKSEITFSQTDYLDNNEARLYYEFGFLEYTAYFIGDREYFEPFFTPYDDVSYDYEKDIVKVDEYEFKTVGLDHTKESQDVFLNIDSKGNVTPETLFSLLWLVGGERFETSCDSFLEKLLFGIEDGVVSYDIAGYYVNNYNDSSEVELYINGKNVSTREYLIFKGDNRPDRGQTYYIVKPRNIFQFLIYFIFGIDGYKLVK